MPVQDLQISLDMDMIPSFGTESISDPQSFGISTTDANPFSMESVDSNPFAMESADSNPFVPEPAVNTNPFAEGLEEVEEAERQALEALKDPNTVPAIISDNRDKLKTQWKENMQKWRSTECVLRDKAEEITAKQDENAKLREQIEALQQALDASQDAVQAKRGRSRAG